MLLPRILGATVVLAICLALFDRLVRRWPCNPGQKAMSADMGLDFAYCAIGALYAGIAPAGATWIGRVIAPTADGRAVVFGGLAAAPLVLQVVLLMAGTDFLQYWLHRAFHSRWLWPFHAIHHSAVEVNWTTTFRIHPLNYLIYNTALSILARAIGFSNTAFLLAAPIWFFFGVFGHANLKWTLGPLRYCIVSPVFHRWHHTRAADTRDRNFSPLLPVWDLLFGTFLMPAGRRPEQFGAAHAPKGLLAQLAHPFRSLSPPHSSARRGA